LFAPYWERGNDLESILVISPVADLSDPAFPPQVARITVLSMEDGILTYLCLRSPDPTI
jgi:hypothetical protein